MPPKSSESYRTPKSDFECLKLSEGRRRLNDVRHARGEPLCTFDEWNNSIIPAMWPNPLDREDYDAWIKRQCRSGPFAGGSSTANPVEREDFVKQVAETDFGNEAQAAALLDVMTQKTRCWLPIGLDPETKVFYRLHPEAHGLRQSHDKIESLDSGHLHPISFLGINFSIEPQDPSLPATDRSVSTQSGETDDMDLDGFVFHQIGKLEYSTDNIKNRKDWGAANWKNSHFYVVGRLNRNDNRIKDIWVIYNMWKINAEGERVWENDLIWGQVPGYGGGVRLSYARIAQTLEDFQRTESGIKLEWSKLAQPINQRTVELVRVFQRNGGFHRLTVAGDR